MAFSSSFTCTYEKQDNSFLGILRLTRRACKNAWFGSLWTILFAGGKVAEQRSSRLSGLAFQLDFNERHSSGTRVDHCHRSFTNRTLCITRLHDHECMYITMGSFRGWGPCPLPTCKNSIETRIVPRDSLYCTHAIARMLLHARNCCALNRKFVKERNNIN